MKALQTTLSTGAAGFALFLALLTPPALASASFDDDDKKKDADEEEEEEEDKDRWYAITGGDVYTGTGAVLRGATVLSKNGKIEEVGFDLFLPEETEVLDATGYRVYPGLVAVQGTSRISRGLFAAEQFEPADPSLAHDHTHSDDNTDPLHPDDDWESAAKSAFATDDDYDHGDASADTQGAAEREERPDFEHGFDPFSSYLVMALSTGITTVDQSGVAAKLKRGEIDGVAMKEKYLATYAWTSSSRKDVRAKFERASEYLREMEVYEQKKKSNKELKEPSKKGVDTSVVDVLEGRKLAKFNSNDRDDLLTIARFAQQYGFRPVIQGCREGWTVAEELGRAGAYAIVTPRTRRPKDERLVRAGGTSIENAAVLHKHGVQVAIIPANTGIDLGGITGRDLLHFPVEAGFAIRGGMPAAAALAGITIIPARILGVDHRVGSLESGKDMDVIVTDGDVLHYQTFVQWAVVDGKLVYDKQDELLFHHIRPRPEPPAPEPEPEAPAEDHDESDEEEGHHDDEEGSGDDEEHEEDDDDGDEEEEEEDEGDGEGDGRAAA
ncbi:MAG: amidohydrolase family protein [Planctomycetota bacterium]